MVLWSGGGETLYALPQWQLDKPGMRTVVRGSLKSVVKEFLQTILSHNSKLLTVYAVVYGRLHRSRLCSNVGPLPHEARLSLRGANFATKCEMHYRTSLLARQ